MENLYDKVLLMKKYKLEPEQMLLESNIKIEEVSEVTKILATSSVVDLDRPIEALSSECMVSGKVICELVYLTSEGEINTQKSVSPFNYKLSNENIEGGAKINVPSPHAVRPKINVINSAQIFLFVFSLSIL